MSVVGLWGGSSVTVMGLAVPVSREQGPGCACPPAPATPRCTWAPGSCLLPCGRGCRLGIPPSALLGLCSFVHLFSFEFRSVSYMVWKLSDPKEQKIREDWVSLPPTYYGLGTGHLHTMSPSPRPGFTHLLLGAGVPRSVE